MRFDNPIKDHGFVFPDLAEFPDYTQESRHEGEADLQPFYEAWQKGDAKAFQAEMHRYIGKPTRWSGKVMEHFGFYQKFQPHTKNQDGNPDTRELYEKGILAKAVDTAPLRRALDVKINSLLGKKDWRPPIGTYDRGQHVNEINGKVQNLFEANGIIEAASQYSGAPRKVEATFLHVSMPTDTHWKQFFFDAETTPRWTNTHIDPKENVIKAIVYLDECSSENGAFGYVPGSNRFIYDPLQDLFGRAISTGSYCPNPEARKSVFALPSFLRVSYNFGRCAIPGSYLDQWLEERFEYFDTSRGNVVVFDPGAGIHQGGITREGRRIALQVLMK